MIYVQGSGFGLYGHAAALASLGHQVGMPQRYRKKASQRPELDEFQAYFSWYDDEKELISNASTVVLCRRPEDNYAAVKELLNQGFQGTLVIEKPVAPNWHMAAKLEESLKHAGVQWFVPYLFEYCGWFPLLQARLRRGDCIQMNWFHQQNPKVNTWKNDSDSGGGAIAFYFIHCLAMLERLFSNGQSRYAVTANGIKADVANVGTSQATLANSALSVDFRIGEQFLFEIKSPSEVLYEALTPFGPFGKIGTLDPRLKPLRKFYQNTVFADSPISNQDFYKSVTSRWQALSTLQMVHS